MSGVAPVRAYVGLGSNQDDPRAQLERAFEALAQLPHTTLLQRSGIYRTPPWGLIEQPAFLNAVAALDTALDASTLLAELCRIERVAGRERSLRWGPRPLDLDLLLHGDTRSDTPELQLPHPRLHERAFVLVPLADVAPDLVLPGHGRIGNLLAEVDRTGIEAVG